MESKYHVVNDKIMSRSKRRGTESREMNESDYLIQKNPKFALYDLDDIILPAFHLDLDKAT